MKKGFKSFTIYILIAAIVFSMAVFINGKKDEKAENVKYSKVVQYLADKKVKSIDFEELTIKATLKNGDKITAFANSTLDISRLYDEYLNKQIKNKDITTDNEEQKKESWLVSLIPTLIMIGVLVFFWMMIMRQQGGGKAMSFGKSRAKLQNNPNARKLTFADVAGLDEEKEELEEIVDFLKHPRKYHNLGARIPKGILLVGPPGTGKTYISRATAGEAGVPFFTISGSDFVEMFVGVGASRVRDLFEQAKKNAPCIIFIDEIDAVGRKRGAGMGGGHDEREQTLNQLLVEMDGFTENLGIIMLAATNRPDILDPALLRPGRFDRQIVIGVPDIKGREEIFKVHSKNKPLDEGVNAKVLARRTPGFTPADIENMLNEAALLTARRNGTTIRMDEIEEAITKVIAGPEKKSRVISDKEKRLTAIHEAGHAVVSHSLPDFDPVHQITIIPRGMAGGFTMTLPKEDRYYNTKGDMENEIVDLLGGRVAEMLVLSDISTGASNDIQRATDIAKNMVTKYGFSEKLGPVNYADSEEVFIGRDFGSKHSYSEETATEIDDEVKRIVHDAYEKAQQILTDNMDKLMAVADALMELETLDGKQFEAVYSGELTVAELVEKTREEEATRSELDEKEAAEAEKAAMEEIDILQQDLARYDENYFDDEDKNEIVDIPEENITKETKTNDKYKEESDEVNSKDDIYVEKVTKSDKINEAADDFDTDFLHTDKKEKRLKDEDND